MSPPTTLYNLQCLKDTRRQLRRNMTEEELILWSVLKNKNLQGRKFRRQHSIGYYIVDFYCPSERLVIEVDGNQHYTPDGIRKDKDRDKHLSDLNIKVLRFRNDEIRSSLTKVLKVIQSNFSNYRND